MVAMVVDMVAVEICIYNPKDLKKRKQVCPKQKLPAE
jgi:hypothetical protein